MKDYANLSGNSGVMQYDAEDEYVIVMFTSGNFIGYNYDDYGKQTVDKIKELAEQGFGLNRFLNTLKQI